MEPMKNETRQKLISTVGEWFTKQLLFPNPDDDTPPGPWSPYIRKALADAKNNFSRLAFFAKFQPEIYDLWGSPLAHLNHQLPQPRIAFIHSLTAQVIERAQLMMDLAVNMQDHGEKRGIIIVSGLFTDYGDALCPTPPIIKLPKGSWWPIPDPEPHPEWGIELVIAGLQFQQAAAHLTSKDLKGVYNKTADLFINTGIQRI